MAKPLLTPIDLVEQAEPGTPASGFVRLYATSQGRLYEKDDAGAKRLLGEPGVFDVETFGASPSASAAANSTAILAAIAAARTAPGGVVRAGPGTFQFQGLLDFSRPDATGGSLGYPVDLQGKGSKQTIFKCTTADSRISFGDTTLGGHGSISGNFRVDGNSVATNPLFFGLMAERSFHNIWVISANGDGAVFDRSQNLDVRQLTVQDCNGAGVRLDNGAAGNVFHRCELTGNVRNVQTLDTAATAAMHNNHWFGCIFERIGPFGCVAHADLQAGSGMSFHGCNFTVSATGAGVDTVMVRLAGAANVAFVACAFKGTADGSAVPHGIGFDVTQPLVNQVIGCTFTMLKTAFQLVANSAMEVDFYRANNVTTKWNSLGTLRPYFEGDLLRFPGKTGTKLALYGEGTATEYLIGVEGNRLAFSVPLAAQRFVWTRGGTAGPEIARLEGDGRLALATTDFGSGTGALVALKNVTAAPSVAPVGGAVLYVEGGVLKVRQSDGSVVPLDTTAAALAAVVLEAKNRDFVHRDSFNRADGATGTLDFPKSRSWTALGSWAVSSNRLVCTTADSYSTATVSTFGALGRLKATVAAGAQGAGEWYVVFNYLSVADHYRVGTTGAGAYVFQNIVAGGLGGFDQLTQVNTPPTPANGDVIEVYRAGNDGIEVLVNGVLIWSAGENDRLPVDTVGFAAFRATTAPAVAFDDFEFAPYDSLTVRDDKAWQAKGDLIVGSRAYRAERVPVGPRADQVLQVDDTQPAGVKWGRAITVASTAPASPALNDLWVNTT